jgi:hypothetical protein
MKYSNDRKIQAVAGIRNDARRAPLSGRPCLRQYHSEHDTEGLVDKSTYRKMHEEKWGGAPWLDSETDKSVIILDNAPAAFPAVASSVSPSSSAAPSQASSRRTTLEDRYLLWECRLMVV